MSTVRQKESVSSTATSGVAETSGLTPLAPEDLLATLDTHLSGLDQQIGAHFAELQSTNGTSNHLSQQIQLLMRLQQALTTADDDEAKVSEIIFFADGSTGIGSAAVNTADAAAELAAAQGEEGPTSAMQLLQELSIEGLQIDPSNPDAKVSIEQIEQCIDQLQEEQRDANSENEMRMTHLQQLVHQRNESISLVTSLLRSMHESSMEIVRNFR
jgi:hypothetical protein